MPDKQLRDLLPNLPEVDEAELGQTIAELERLEGPAYERALTRMVFDPTPAEQIAFRHPRLITKSIAATRSMIDRVNRDLRSNPKRQDPDWRGRAEAFRTRIGEERRLLEALLADMRASEGSIAETSLRAQAKNRLWAENPVRGLQILRELQEEQRAKRQAEKEQRRAAKVAEGQAKARLVRRARYEENQ